MSNRLFFIFAGVAAVFFVALAAVTPQGLGARSPAPFGHPVARPPESQAEIDAREAAARIAASPGAAAALARLRQAK
jgi:hypothetical protein